MKVKIKIIVIIGLLSLVFNCWDKQNHDITRPIVPHYIFNGTAVDYDSGESLEGIIVELAATKMLYDIQFFTQTDTTDSSGHFSFDMVYPGYYTWRVQKEGCWLNEKKLEIKHRDSTSVIAVPHLLYGKIFDLRGSSHPAFAINGTKAWFSTYSMTPYFKRAQMFFVYTLTNRGWFEEGYYLSPLYKKNVTSMAFGRDALYVCVAPDTLYLINTMDGSLTGKYQMKQNITAVAYHPPQNCIYTCSKNNLYRHESEQPINIVSSWNFENHTLSAIAYYKGIYTYDNTNYLLRKYSTEMNVEITYALVDADSKIQILNIYDMSFDGYGMLWVTLP
ncbi:MAG TPA: carboxypeptidase-like regulatory domain-containing protein [bacterium]|nr:carboxypeptidase-like regulatory domain-containing protein [bacterium]HPN45164.1 carboxypeptidase-like regulatory domain-containing protein [bacterium]